MASVGAATQLYVRLSWFWSRSDAALTRSPKHRLDGWPRIGGDAWFTMMVAGLLEKCTCLRVTMPCKANRNAMLSIYLNQEKHWALINF